MGYIKTPQERDQEGFELRPRHRSRINLRNWLLPFTAWMKAFSKPYTLPKKQTFRKGADRYRGLHVNDLEACTGCGSCADICMNNAIDMVAWRDTTKKDTGYRPRLDYGRCCWCGLCVDICATCSLGLSEEYLLVSDNPDDFRFTPGVEPKPWDNLTKGWRRVPKKKAKKAKE